MDGDLVTGFRVEPITSPDNDVLVRIADETHRVSANGTLFVGQVVEGAPVQTIRDEVVLASGFVITKAEEEDEGEWKLKGRQIN